MAPPDRNTRMEIEGQPEIARAPRDQSPAVSFRCVRVLTGSGQAYWTVVDRESETLDSADGYLRFLRFELDADELATKQYARNLLYFLGWVAEMELDLQTAAASLRSFSAQVRSMPATRSDEPLLHRPERVEQILATVHGFYMYLVGREVLPIQALDQLHEVVDLRDPGVTSYAQNGEDLQISYYVGREHVTYVDVGCLWPKHFSNSYFFYERAGSGLCIDANPTLAEQYQRERPRDLFLNCGIGACPDTMTYYMHTNPVFNTLSAEHATELADRVSAMQDSPQRKGRTLTETLEVAVMTLDEAVISTGFAARCGGRVDFLSIDVEGLELEVLAGFSFHELRPRLVVVEEVRHGAAVRLAPDELPIAQTLKAHRYWLAGHSGINLYFMDEDR